MNLVSKRLFQSPGRSVTRTITLVAVAFVGSIAGGTVTVGAIARAEPVASDVFYDSAALGSVESQILGHFGAHRYNLGIAMADLTPSEWNNLYRVFPDSLRAEIERAPERRLEITLRRYGLYQDPKLPMPAAFSRLKGNRYRVNCLFCHGGPVPGPDGPHFSVGAPNRRADVTAFFLDRLALAERFPRYSSAHRVLDRIAFPAFRKLLADVRLNTNRGTVAVWKFSSLEIATRTRGMGYSPSGLLGLLRGKVDDFDVAAIDVDPLPWWNTKLKRHLWMDAWIPKSGRAFSVNIPGPFNALRREEAGLDELVGELSELPVPRYPFVIDSIRAGRGKVSFNDHCAGCHGTYADDGSTTWPEMVVPLAQVGTDPARVLVGMTERYRKFVGDSWIGDYGKDDVRLAPDGYVAPPLRGVWATAPYLHNGSVPTLAAFLELTDRPHYWRASVDGFDEEAIGLRYETFTERAPSDIDIFDTTRLGKSSAGHLFHRSLTTDERRDVLEYLKSL